MWKIRRRLNKILSTPVVFFIVLLTLFYWYLYANYYIQRRIHKVWKEQVQLSNGDTIWLERKASYKYRRGIRWLIDVGSLSDIKLTINIPTKYEESIPKWEFDAFPIFIDYDDQKKSWVIIASFLFCGAWSKAGRPPFKQWQYELQDNKWVVVPISRQFKGRKANLATSAVNLEFPKKSSLTIADVENSQRGVMAKIYTEVIEIKQTCRPD